MNTALHLMLDTAQLPADGMAMPGGQGTPAGIDFSVLLSQQQMPETAPVMMPKTAIELVDVTEQTDLPNPSELPMFSELELENPALDSAASAMVLTKDAEATTEQSLETTDESESLPLWQVRLPFELETKRPGLAENAKASVFPTSIATAANVQQAGGKELPVAVNQTNDVATTNLEAESGTVSQSTMPSMFASELDAVATTSLDNKLNPFQLATKPGPLTPATVNNNEPSANAVNHGSVLNKNEALAGGPFTIEQLISEGKQQSSQMAVTPGPAVNIRWRAGQRETEPVSVVSSTTSTASSTATVQTLDASSIGKPFLPLFSPQFAELLGQQTLSMSQRRIDSAEIRLDPPDLGPMEIKVSQSEGEIKVHFIVQQAQTREQVENAINRLREMFDASQLQLTDVTVEQRDRQSQQEKSDGGLASSSNAATGEHRVGEAGRTTATLAERLFDAYA